MTLKLRLQLAVSVAVLVTSAVITGHAVASLRARAAEEAERIRAEKTAEVRRDLADKVNTVWALVDAQYREAADERYLERKYGQRLRAVLDLARATLDEHVARARRGEVSLARAQADALATLRAMRFDGGKGYLWINDTGRPFPRMVMHPTVPALEGKVLDAPEFDCAGDQQRNLFALAVELATTRGDGFIRYAWPEPDGTALVPHMPKFSYVRHFPAWGWVVGTGIYVDEAVREKLADVTAGVRAIRYGPQYYWISTGDQPPRMVMHPMRPELDGRTVDLPEFRLAVNGREQNLFSALRDLAKAEGQGYAEYAWPKPREEGGAGPPAAKISFVRHYAPLDWIIGTGRHVDDIEVAIAERTAAADAQVSGLVRSIVLASLAAVALAVLAVSLLTASLTRPLGALAALTRDIAGDEAHLSRRVGLRSRDEIGELARGFDHMAERVEASFREVRSQRELLRSVLGNVPHAIWWKDRRLVFLGCNERFAERFGLAGPEAIGGRTEAALGWTEAQRARSEARDRAVLERGEPLLDQEETLRDASGRDVPGLASRVPLRDQAGELIGVLGVFVALPAPAAVAAAS